MSMISSLIDELRKSEDEWNGSNMFELARMCREAADTIWQLRDDLQRANTENAKLRELVADLWEYIYIGTAQDGQRLHDRTRELGIEEDA